MEHKPRLYQAVNVVLDAEQKIDVPVNLWNSEQEEMFKEKILSVLTENISVEDFGKMLQIK